MEINSRGISKKATTLLTLIGSIIVVMMHSTPIYAQYYSWGPDEVSLKWSDIKGEDIRVIYPDTVDGIARRTLYYVDAVKDDISFGYSYPALKIPFVMHPENFQSNAMVMWMPKRIDFLTTPSIDNFSMLWWKHLVAHEYRHAVQYNNLNKGVVKWLSYIIGEQGATAGLLFLPLDIIEGDAVKCETSMSTFGRGLQPSFSMGYRAIGRDMLNRKNIDRWFCGSYNYYVPDHYQLGYQIVDYSYTKYDENIWNKVADFAVHRPYYIVTTSTALKKFYNTDNAKLMRETFNDLFDYWDSLPMRTNSTEIISTIDTDNYITYSHPMPHSNGEEIIALREDYRYASRFVAVDAATGSERNVAYTGNVSTRPTLGGDNLWWSEYRSSKLFAEKVYSQLCYMNLKEQKTRTIKGFGQTLYPTAIGSEGKIAYVEYDPKGLYSIVVMESKNQKPRSSKDFIEVARTPITQYTEVHGLAWDDVTDNLYFIATDDSGMWLGALDSSDSKNGFRQLREGAYITISDLRASGGRLYFGSIESGYDELHCYDIESDIEYRISQSTYGSFAPSTPSKDGYSYATTYDKYGYHLSRQKLGDIEDKVTPKNIPQNIVNPKRTQWDLVNLDSVDYTSIDSLTSHQDHKSRKYNKGLKLLKIHSWFPMAFNPYDIVDEQRIDVSLGATVMSQNLLSSAEAYASYGYNQIEGSLIKGGLKYKGLGVDLDFGVAYGGDQIVYTPMDNTTYSQQEYYSFTTTASLPLIYQRGYHNRQLSAWVSWNYTNGVLFDLDEYVYNKLTNSFTNYGTIGFTTGLHKMSVGIGYSDVVRSAHRDLSTPFGYSITAKYAMCPSDSDFSDLISFYGKLYTRGIFPYNSLSLEGCYQTSIGGYTYNGINLLSFSSVSLLPRGFSSTDIRNSNYMATSINYKFPILYPEGGIGSILYFKRLSLSVGFDGAQFEDYSNKQSYIYSYGGSLILDINPLRMPEASTTAIELSLFQPNIGPLSFTMGVVLPF